MSNDSQNVTTIHNNISTDSDLQMTIVKLSHNLFLQIIQTLIGCFNLFGNLLVIRVIYYLPNNSKLRKTTRLLISYVSTGHCFLSMLLLFRFLKPPCFVIFLSTILLVFNLFGGVLYLALETLVLIKKPYNHHTIISMNVCRVGVSLSFLVSVCFAYATMKEADEPSVCYITNGTMNPFVLCFLSAYLCMMFFTTSAIQISTLKAMKKVFPENTPAQHNSTGAVSYISTVPDPVNVQPPQATSQQRTPLHKLVKILSVTLLISILCWSPISIAMLVFSLFEILHIEVQVERQILFPLSSLVLLHGSLHFIVYLGMSTHIREAAKKYTLSWICLIKIFATTDN